jgi:hypothetical protein
MFESYLHLASPYPLIINKLNSKRLSIESWRFVGAGKDLGLPLSSKGILEVNFSSRPETGLRSSKNLFF